MGVSLFFYEDLTMSKKNNMMMSMTKFMEADLIKNTIQHERQREAAVIAEQGFQVIRNPPKSNANNINNLTITKRTTTPKKAVKSKYRDDLKDHEVRELVNDLRDIAKKYHDYQCLRELIANRLMDTIKKD